MRFMQSPAQHTLAILPESATMRPFKPFCRFLIFAAIVPILATLALGEEEDEPLVAAEDSHAPVHVAIAHTGTLGGQIRAIASVVPAPRTPTRIVSQGSGIISQVLLDEGSQVTAGTPVLTLDARALVAEETRATKSLDAANAALRAASEGGLDANQAALDAESKRADSTRALLEAEFKRVSALRGEGLNSDKAVSEANAALESATADSEMARANASQYRQSGRAAELAALDAAVSEAEAAAVAAHIAREAASVNAPCSGTLGRVLVEPGAWVDAGTPVAEIIPDGAPNLVILLSMEDAEEISVGALVSGVDGATSFGQIISIGTGLDTDTGLIRVLAHCTATDGLSLRIGRSIPVSVTTSHLFEGIVVPAAALSFDEEEAVVAIVDGQHAKVFPVEILTRGGGQVCVASDELEDGAQVIVDGNDNLADGTGIVVETAPHE